MFVHVVLRCRRDLRVSPPPRECGVGGFGPTVSACRAVVSASQLLDGARSSAVSRFKPAGFIGFKFCIELLEANSERIGKCNVVLGASADGFPVVHDSR